MMVIIYIAVVLLSAFAYYKLLLSYGKSWLLLNDYSENLDNANEVTVLIPFRNEAENLPILITSFRSLDTRNYQVQFIFINDHSTDHSTKIIEQEMSDTRFKLVNLIEGTGKKSAIKLGWKLAEGNIILQTDADCEVPKNWLIEMIKPFSDNKIQMVSGPVSFQKQNGFFHEVVHLDFLGLIAIGAAHIQQKNPLICNGANLAYKKAILQNVDLHDAKASGDDVFLMQSIDGLYPNSVAFCKSQEAIVITKGPQSFNEFWNQRLRWASKNNNYSNKGNLSILIGVWLYNLMIVLSALSLTPLGLSSALFLVIVKWLAEDGFYAKVKPFFSLPSKSWLLGLGQIFHVVYMAMLPLFSQVISYQWKERKLK